MSHTLIYYFNKSSSIQVDFSFIIIPTDNHILAIPIAHTTNDVEILSKPTPKNTSAIPKMNIDFPSIFFPFESVKIKV